MAHIKNDLYWLPLLSVCWRQQIALAHLWAIR